MNKGNLANTTFKPMTPQERDLVYKANKLGRLREQIAVHLTDIQLLLGNKFELERELNIIKDMVK